ncbi:MAG TPA: hypothetical protein PK110_02720 [Niabella sp.]|nr:hypothetical protein [Niabella sp.]HRO83715.1 hypothetical protein [Niabella sp.]
MIKFILLAIVFYLMYNFIVKFVLPVYKTTQQIKTRFRDIKNQQDSYNNSSQQTQNTEVSKEIEGEYIDYEEVK